MKALAAKRAAILFKWLEKFHPLASPRLKTIIAQDKERANQDGPVY
jgi:hypothetical protein